MSDTPDLSDLRDSDRFVPAQPVVGSFGSVGFTIINLGIGGLQIEHPDPLKIGNQSRLALEIPAAKLPEMRGRVVWSRLSRTPNPQGKYLYRSGLRVDEDKDILARSIGFLIKSGRVHLDSHSLERKKLAQEEKARRAANPVMKLVSTRKELEISADQVLLIQHARDRLKSNPQEAMKWYNRAKFSMNEQAVKGTSDSVMPFKEEVIAVWEYLERTIDLPRIAQVFDMQKK